MSSQRRGLLAESRLISEILSRGWDVCVPVDSYQPYDIVVDNGKNLIKVQVKSSDISGEIQINVSRNGQGKSPYKSTDYDVLAVYLAGAAQWYIMPHLRVRIIRFGGKNVKYNKFLNNWELFEKDNLHKAL